jgi:hypothetical protein
MELKSLTRRSKCVGAESGCLSMLRECLSACSMRLWVPFIAPRQLGSVGDQHGRLSLPSVEWRTGQSGARCLISVQIGHSQPLLLRAGWWTGHCPVHTEQSGAPADHWSSHVSRVDRADDRWCRRHWLTGQSGALLDSPVNYSHVALLLFPRATSLPRMTHRTIRCTTGQSGEL